MRRIGVAVDADLHTRVKIAALKQGKTLTQFIIDLIIAALGEEHAKEKE